jgi:hypothetical protein
MRLADIEKSTKLKVEKKSNKTVRGKNNNNNEQHNKM